MKSVFYVQNVPLADLELSVQKLLSDIDASKFDKELAAAGISRPSGVEFAKNIEIGVGHGISPGQWAEIIVAFSPLVAQIGSDLWKIIIVPQLKRIFSEDKVSNEKPD